eukprot:5120662-Pyramimonas_sp.AAC.1
MKDQHALKPRGRRNAEQGDGGAVGMGAGCQTQRGPPFERRPHPTARSSSPFRNPPRESWVSH